MMPARKGLFSLARHDAVEPPPIGFIFLLVVYDSTRRLLLYSIRAMLLSRTCANHHHVVHDDVESMRRTRVLHSQNRSPVRVQWHLAVKS